jgi:hypothetical protein
LEAVAELTLINARRMFGAAASGLVPV